jgi:hypothetical protein
MKRITRAAGAAMVLCMALFAPGIAEASAGPVPASGTPNLAVTGGPQTELVHQFTKCNGIIYTAGQFGPVTSNGQTYQLHNAFSFSAYSPYGLTSWRPDVNGTVDSITLSPDCADAWLGGEFSTVNGQQTGPLAEVSTSTGQVVSSFRPDISGQVDTVLYANGHLLVGGGFRGLYFSLNPATGRHDGFFDDVDVHGALPNTPSRVYRQQLSPNGKRLLVEGAFTRAGGQSRQQIFMVNLDKPKAEVTGWTNFWFYRPCIDSERFYVRNAAWSQDGSTIVIGSTGKHLLSQKSGQYPLGGLCDAVAAFPSNWTSVQTKWVEHSGCDSYYTVADTGGTVLAAGHPRWADNSNGCNFAGRGAIPDRGLQGFSEATGRLVESGGRPEYSMSRANADYMLVTPSGVWIGSGNRFGSDQCEGRFHVGICWIPLR